MLSLAIRIAHLHDFRRCRLAEIAGCFAFWAWLRQGKSILWLAPGVVR
jgi:small multidrug resistance family-3 protein